MCSWYWVKALVIYPDIDVAEMARATYLAMAPDPPRPITASRINADLNTITAIWALE